MLVDLVDVLMIQHHKEQNRETLVDQVVEELITRTVVLETLHQYQHPNHHNKDTLEETHLVAELVAVVEDQEKLVIMQDPFMLVVLIQTLQLVMVVMEHLILDSQDLCSLECLHLGRMP